MQNIIKLNYFYDRRKNNNNKKQQNYDYQKS